MRTVGMNADSTEDGESSSDGRDVWLVERTYSDDEQNLIILTYATPDGRLEFRKERALTSFSDSRDTSVSLTVERSNLGAVDDAETRERYVTEIERMRERHDPTDRI